MPRVIAYDMARLFIGPIFLTPRGIDRVDLAVARHVFAKDDSPNLAILPTPWGVQAFPAAIARRLLAQLQNLWSEDVQDTADAKLQQLIARISAPDASHQTPPEPSALPLSAKVRRMLAELQKTGIRRGQSARRAVPQGSAYINIGQLGLAVPLFSQWLDDRPDITCAIMMHDIIPLEYPDLVSPAAVEHHARMVRTTAHHADCLIFNSEYARASVTGALARHRAAIPPSLVRALPLAPAFAEAAGGIPLLADIAYFVVVSTVEPRKNHRLLLRVWRHLVAELGERAPHLIIVGLRGSGADDLIAEIRRERGLWARIHIVSGLSSRALASVILGSTGVLSPSLVEGFGLPILEANALGVPTIASDIPAHREVGNATTVFLPPHDDIGWKDAILKARHVRRTTRPPIPHHMTEAAYSADLIQFVANVGDVHGRKAVA